MAARWAALTTAAAALVLVSNGTAAAQGLASWPSAQFSGALLQQYPYLLEAAPRAALDEINRSLRLAVTQQANRNSTAEIKAKGATAQIDAERRLLALLDTVTGVVRATFADRKAVLLPAGPFTLPGDTGAILFRVETGPGEAHFSTREVNFSDTRVISIPVGESGTTWALVGFSHVPRKRTTAPVSFAAGGTIVGTALIDLITPEPGRLKLTVLSHDTGQPSPAMVRLVWKTDGQVLRPGNGIDFDPQFDHQGRQGARVANLPGALRGPYWTVPGPIDTTVPAGEWEVTIRRGMEHVPVVDTFTVSPGQTVERTYRPRRWVSMPTLGWYSGDDHVHCQILSEADAQRIMTWAKAEDVHLCNVVKMGDVNRTFFEQRGFGKTHRVVDGDYVLSPGQECPRTDELGHTLAMNISSMIRDTDRYFLYDWVFDQVHAQGGLTGYAHVLTDSFSVHRDMSVNVPRAKVDFVELMQFFILGTDLYYEFLNTGFKITASAGSDVPWGGTIGEVRTYALTGAGTFDADRWFEAVRQGHTFVTDGPMLQFTVDQALPGDQIDVKGTRPLHVRARVWGDPEASMPSKLEVVQNGEVIRSTQPTDPKQSELRLEFDVYPANGFWIAARAEGADGTRAHTTPVYVVKPGLRFWKFADLDTLVAKRLANLDEIETLIADRAGRNARGEAGANRAFEQLALEGPELLKRVAAARQIYEDLKKIADKERPLRESAESR